MPRTVLVVDDDPFFQRTLADGLRGAGYQVSVAANGLEAIESVRQSPPDFILLDLIMPKLDGIRVCKMLKRHPQHRRIPVIILTGAIREGLKVLDDIGADATLAKREAATTLPEILKTLQFLEASPQQQRPPEEAAAGLTERRIVSELLAERRHTQTLLDTLGEGVVELDDAGQVVYVNTAGQAILGRIEDEILGCPGVDLLGPTNAPALRQALGTVQAEAEGHTARLNLVHGQKTIGVTLTALRVPGGAPGALIVLRDLTDLTRRARSLQALPRSASTSSASLTSPPSSGRSWLAPHSSWRPSAAPSSGSSGRASGSGSCASRPWGWASGIPGTFTSAPAIR